MVHEVLHYFLGSTVILIGGIGHPLVSESIMHFFAWGPLAKILRGGT